MGLPGTVRPGGLRRPRRPVRHGDLRDGLHWRGGADHVEQLPPYGLAGVVGGQAAAAVFDQPAAGGGVAQEIVVRWISCEKFLPPLTGLRRTENASSPGAYATGLLPDAPAGLEERCV